MSYIIDRSYSKQVTESNKDDLFQEGMLGLLEAIDKFEPSMGFRFSTYSSWWIKQSIINYLKVNKHLTHVPSHILNQFCKSSTQLKSLGKTVTDNISEFTADELGITNKMHHCLSMMRGVHYSSISLDTAMLGIECGNLIQDERVIKATTVLPDQEPSLYSWQIKKAAATALTSLDDREMNVLLLRYSLPKSENTAKKYASTTKKGKYVTMTDGLDYRTIAKIMHQYGWPMNHATARNVLVSAYTKFFISFLSEIGLPSLTKSEICDLIKNQSVHDMLPDILCHYKPFEKLNMKDETNV